jgi:NitT/TauT family transport system substrate-binding protein
MEWDAHSQSAGKELDKTLWGGLAAVSGNAQWNRMPALETQERTMRKLNIIAAMMLVLSTIAVGNAKADDKVTLRLDWVYGAEHAGVFVAQQKGFFKEEGIDVDILPGEGSSVTIKLVGTGNVEFGYATADQALLANSRGLPIVVTAVILQSSPNGILFRKSKNIKTLTDLYGKRLGLQIKTAGEQQWRAIARMHNLDMSKIDEVAADLAVSQLIIADKIDAGIGFFFNDGTRPAVEGIDMGWMLIGELGLPMYSSSLIVNAETIKKNPDLVRRFTKAFVRGWEYAKAHPDEAYALTIKAQPTLDNTYNKLKLPLVLKLLDSNATAKAGIGASTKEGWEAMQQSMIKTGMIASPLDVSTVYTTEFLPKKN